MTDGGGAGAGGDVERAMQLAQSKLGFPYVWATAGPESFDCSGFTYWVASQILGELPSELRDSHKQFADWGEAVAERRRGDLVFFDTADGGEWRLGNAASHVGFELGNGTLIHAANPSDGVIISEWSNDYYRSRFIGARRIFAAEASTGGKDGGNAGESAGGNGGGLRVPAGPIRTAAPWNGRPIGADWALIGRWKALIDREAAAAGVEPVEIAAVMAVETQGVHERDGQVLEVWDNHPEDGPSVGLMQVKPRVWGYLDAAADPYTPAGNIRLGALVLATLMETFGGFEQAIAGGYHPGTGPNGTTPRGYVAAVRSLKEELDAA